MHIGLSLLAGAALLLTALPAAGVPADRDAPEPHVKNAWSDKTPPPPSDRVIVRWAEGASRSERARARKGVKAATAKNLGGSRFQLLGLTEGQDAARAVSELKRNPNVADAALDGYSVLYAAPPDDPMFPDLWGLDNGGRAVGGAWSARQGADVSALEAWDKTTGDEGVVVANLDSGVLPDHPDLRNQIWRNVDELPDDGIDNDGNGYADDTFGMDFVGANIDVNPLVFDNDPTDDIGDGHGVHTSGTIAAEGGNGEGVVGVAPQSTIMPVRVCGWSPSWGGVLCPFSAQIAGINYAGTNGATVANMSLGGTSGAPLVRDAFAANPQVLFVIAAGNDGNNVEVGGRTTYPCSWDPTESNIEGAVDNVVCVAASDQEDLKAGFSNYGAAKVDLAAPGTEILSTYKPSDRLVEAARYEEDFEDDFDFAGWTNEGWTKVISAPQKSYEVTNDTATQAPGTVRSLTTPAMDVEGAARCRVSYKSTFVGTGWTPFRVYITWDGTSPGYLPGYLSDRWLDVPGGAKAFSLRFAFERTTTMPDTAGVWLDDVRIACFDAVPGDYQYLQGTSMATPHVSGAAALLAAYEPDATTMQVKDALLSSVDKLDAFAIGGSTPVATGGRLNADRALEELDALVAPDTVLTAAPPESTDQETATFEFSTTSEAPVVFECRVDGDVYSVCTTPFTTDTLDEGSHDFEVRARDLSSAANVDPSPAAFQWTVVPLPTVDPPVTRPPAPPVVTPPSAPPVVAPPSAPPPENPPVAGAPGKVKKVTAKTRPSKRKVIVMWKRAARASAYRVRISKPSGTKYTTWRKTIKRKRVFTTTLRPGRKYRAQVRAIGPGGRGPITTKRFTAR